MTRIRLKADAYSLGIVRKLTPKERLSVQKKLRKAEIKYLLRKIKRFFF